MKTSLKKEVFLFLFCEIMFYYQSIYLGFKPISIFYFGN